jgi:hypothetical protein
MKTAGEWVNVAICLRHAMTMKKENRTSFAGS